MYQLYFSLEVVRDFLRDSDWQWVFLFFLRPTPVDSVLNEFIVSIFSVSILHLNRERCVGKNPNSLLSVVSVELNSLSELWLYLDWLKESDIKCQQLLRVDGTLDIWRTSRVRWKHSHMYLSRLWNRSVCPAFEADDTEVSLDLINITSCTKNFRVVTFTMQSSILINKSDSIVLNSWCELINLILQV